MNGEAAAPAGRLMPVLLVALLGLASFAALLATSNLAAAILPMAAVAFFWVTWTTPLRRPAILLVAVGLSVLNPQEQPGSAMRTILTDLGGYLVATLNTVVPVKALRFSGCDALMAYFALVALWRVAHRSRIDVAMVQTARPLLLAALASIGSVGVVWLWGVSRGGDIQQTLWQTHTLLAVPLLFLLLSAMLRGPQDAVPLARAVIFAAMVKSLLALWIRYVIVPGLGRDLPFATSHDDSMLFATATVILLARLNERIDRRSLRAALFILPLLAGGMIANTRRIVWVDVALALVIVGAVSRRTAIKRFILRALVLSVPVVALYLAAGWKSGAAVFAPARMIRTMVSADVDRSTATRDIENFNLVWTLKEHPVLGTGWGHEYVEKVLGDDISKFFSQYRYIPHNSVLGLWAFCGVAGFTGIWMLFVVGVFLAARSYRQAQGPEMRAAAASCIAAIFIVALQCYGDMGLASWTSVFLAAPALTLAGKLAVATGAWRVRAARPAVAGALLDEAAPPLAGPAL